MTTHAVRHKELAAPFDGFYIIWVNRGMYEANLW